MSRTECWTDLPHHQPHHRECEQQTLLHGSVDINVAVGNGCERDRLRVDIQAIDEKLYRYGLLPHLQVACLEKTQPMRTDCFGYQHDSF